MLFFRVFQQIAGLTVQRLAYRDQGREADRADASVLEFTEVDIRDADLLAEFVESYLPICHHAVESYDDLSHSSPYTVSSCSFWSMVPYLKIIASTKMMKTNATEMKSISKVKESEMMPPIAAFMP